jgi:hypothetical protein
MVAVLSRPLSHSGRDHPVYILAKDQLCKSFEPNKHRHKWGGPTKSQALHMGFWTHTIRTQCEPPECLFSHFVSVLDGIVRTSNGMSPGQSSLDLAERVFM